MDQDERVHQVFAVGGLLSAFGVSSAAGLNATLPLLTIGLLSRWGHLDIAPSYTFLGSTPGLIILGVVFIVDGVGDKIPGVDHVLHLIGMVGYPAAGAIAFASQHGLVGHLPGPVSLALGFVTAGGFHVTRSAVRPVATAATVGFGNPVLSGLEDVTSAVLTTLALLLPLLAMALVVVLAVITWRAIRRLRRGVRRLRSVPN
jgi:hypothetical protein